MRMPWFDLAQGHQIPDDHEPNDVMVPTKRPSVVDRMIQRRYSRTSFAPTARKLALMSPEVPFLLGFAEAAIDAADEFAPADELTDEAL